MTMPPTLTLEATTDEDIVNPARPTFKIFSNALKAFEKEVNGTTRKYLACTASSTVEDLHGDRMTEACVQGMAPQAKSKQMTIFLNHSYKVPEDVFGKTVDSKIVSRSGDGGMQVWDLDLEIELNEANARATDTYAAIKDQGMKLGVSIGAMIEDYEFIDEEAGFWGGLEIKEVNLLEASIVGIPANQRSWVVNGLVALGAPKAIINKALGRTKESNPPKPAPEPPAPPPPPPPPAPAPEPSELKTMEFRVFDASGKDITDEVKIQSTEKDADDAPASPEAESQDGGDTSSDDDDEATETTASATLEDAEAAVDALAAAGADASMLEILLSFLEGATDEVASLRKRNKDLNEELEKARTDVQRAAEIVETIARTPLGRKAQFEAPVSTFRSRYAGYYSEGLLKLLDGEETNERGLPEAAQGRSGAAPA